MISFGYMPDLAYWFSTCSYYSTSSPQNSSSPSYRMGSTDTNAASHCPVAL